MPQTDLFVKCFYRLPVDVAPALLEVAAGLAAGLAEPHLLEEFEGGDPVAEILPALNERAPDAIWALEAEGEGIGQSLEWLENNGYLKEK